MLGYVDEVEKYGKSVVEENKKEKKEGETDDICLAFVVCQVNIRNWCKNERRVGEGTNTKRRVPTYATDAWTASAYCANSEVTN